MKLVTVDIDGTERAGVLLGDQILDLAAAAAALNSPAATGSVLDILKGGAGALDQLAKLVAGAEANLDDMRAAGALLDAGAARYRPPIPNPGFILSVGMNYRAHLEEMNTPIPELPAAFVKSPTSLTGSGEPIVLPPDQPDMVDFEGELCFVFGRDCYRVSEADAMDYVAGYTIANDVSARDRVAGIFTAEGNMAAIHAWEANVLGKQYPTFTPMGPVLVTRDEIADPGALRLVTKLDGEVMQDSLTELVFPIARLIAHYSQWYRFRPGDVVTTGSPPGVGFGRDPKVFMKPGQLIEVTIEGIGTLSNPVIAG
ncbi:MAG: fumarylacetoacetate hydrolase family protein [Alphaproteobacteria bacterium]|nr:fumarylacetoacetate hydrolase family protein [Alphaproteobacteria bacterium]